MNTKYSLLTRLTLVLVSGLLTCSLLYYGEAQEAPAKSEKSEKLGKPSSLTLTAAEKTTRDSLLTEVQSAQRELGTLFDQMLSTDDEDKVLGIYYRAKARVTSRLKPANEKLTAWFDSVRKAHKCEGCQLQGDTLVPAPLPGQVPLAATPAPK